MVLTNAQKLFMNYHMDIQYLHIDIDIEKALQQEWHIENNNAGDSDEFPYLLITPDEDCEYETAFDQNTMRMLLEIQQSDSNKTITNQILEELITYLEKRG